MEPRKLRDIRSCMLCAAKERAGKKRNNAAVIKMAGVRTDFIVSV
jgi:hypothetical protein